MYLQNPTVKNGKHPLGQLAVSRYCNPKRPCLDYFTDVYPFFQIQVAQALKASLDMEYHKASDSLIIHRYGIDAVSEKVVQVLMVCLATTACILTNHYTQAPLEHDSRYLLFQKLNILADAAFQDMSVLPARESFMSIMVKYQEQCTNHKLLTFCLCRTGFPATTTYLPNLACVATNACSWIRRNISIYLPWYGRGFEGKSITWNQIERCLRRIRQPALLTICSVLSVLPKLLQKAERCILLLSYKARRTCIPASKRTKPQI